jgi:hypothetical protein
MPRVFLFVMTLSILPLALCMSAGAQQSKSAGTEVLYVLTASQLETYDVDRTTGELTEVGQPIAVSNSNLPVSSKDDLFIYLLGFDAGNNEHIWVYATDATGAPQVPAIQDLSVSDLTAFEIDPNGKLAYVVQSSVNGEGQTVASINVFSRTPATGLLSGTSQVVATYPPNGPCGTAWSQEGSLSLPGFSRNNSASGSAFYDEWYCTAYNTDSYGIYYERAFDKKTGALGSETQFFSAVGNGAWFTAKNITDYYNPTEADPEIYIYPPSGGTTPLIACTAEMLESCGYATNVLADPAGEYIFLQVEPDYGEVDRIEMGGKKIVTTGNFVPDTLWTISPDRAILYTLVPNEQNPPIVDTYLFDTKTGTVQAGGVLEIIDADNFVALSAAIRE